MALILRITGLSRGCAVPPCSCSSTYVYTAAFSRNLEGYAKRQVLWVATRIDDERPAPLRAVASLGDGVKGPTRRAILGSAIGAVYKNKIGKVCHCQPTIEGLRREVAIPIHTKPLDLIKLSLSCVHAWLSHEDECLAKEIITG